MFIAIPIDEYNENGCVVGSEEAAYYANPEIAPPGMLRHFVTYTAIPSNAKQMYVLLIAGSNGSPVQKPIIFYNGDQALAEKLKIESEHSGRNNAISILIKYHAL